MPMYLTYRLEEFKTRNASEEERDAAFGALHDVHAPIAIRDILHMRGLYIKLGQMMTTRADYAPPAFMKALSVLQDAVPARPFAAIAEDVRRELGVEKLSDLFLSIEEQPLGGEGA
jgi:aarF domain-containing kinase